MSPEEHKADRRLYRQMWYIVRKHPGTPEADAARQWLADREAARKLAHPPRPPYQKRARASRASRRCNRKLTQEEKDRLHELKRIRYSLDDDFRARVNEYCRDYYRRKRAKILADHREYNARPEVKAHRVARRNANAEAAAARRAARQAARHASWTSAMLTKAELKKLPPIERRRVRQRQTYRKRVAASTP